MVDGVYVVSVQKNRQFTALRAVSGTQRQAAPDVARGLPVRQKYLTNLNHKSEFARVISAFHHGAGIFSDAAPRSLENTACSPGKERGKGQEVAPDSPCDKTALLSSLNSGEQSLGIQLWEDCTDEQPNFSSSNMLSEDPKKLKTEKKKKKQQEKILTRLEIPKMTGQQLCKTLLN